MEKEKTMNKHVEEAMKLRNATPMCNNCAQTILRVYAEEMGMSEDLAAVVGSNFGSGMRCGGTCGAITAARNNGSPLPVFF